tara:strand:+ start:2834 stop:3208 length:375 start_codon:yes stop_codon:yes gene_type:complete
VPKKTTILSATILYTTAITVLSLASLSNKLPKLNTGFDDKIAHFLIYAIFCLMWFLTFKSFDLKRSLICAFSFSILFGLVIELLQGMEFIGRTKDAFDFLANLIGAISMTGLIYIKNKVLIKKT